jgi:hypothetical protein
VQQEHERRAGSIQCGSDILGVLGQSPVADLNAKFEQAISE